MKRTKFRKLKSSLRIAAGMTQAQLAEAIGAGETTVYSWEHGRHEPRAYFIEALCRIFACSEAELFE